MKIVSFVNFQILMMAFYEKKSTENDSKQLYLTLIWLSSCVGECHFILWHCQSLLWTRFALRSSPFCLSIIIHRAEQSGNSWGALWYCFFLASLAKLVLFISLSVLLPFPVSFLLKLVGALGIKVYGMSLAAGLGRTAMTEKRGWRLIGYTLSVETGS